MGLGVSKASPDPMDPAERKATRAPLVTRGLPASMAIKENSGSREATDPLEFKALKASPEFTIRSSTRLESSELSGDKVRKGPLEKSAWRESPAGLDLPALLDLPDSRVLQEYQVYK